ncbi:MAG: prepilin-type N-terminal cleavage/methylation domain-containing protein [Betaproteobacteria bacterium]|nr:prepilin-type N-terminal cleavage/methylation domain-containing protein [Betaproteobacteria bacterium]
MHTLSLPPWSISPWHPQRRPMRSLGGFTLLELLVVMALLALMAGLVMPNLARMIESYEKSLKWSALQDEIDSLPFKAYSQSRAITLTPNNARQLLGSLPIGWTLQTKTPIRYRDNGWCEGGRLTLITDDGERRDIDLIAPRCSVAGT